MAPKARAFNRDLVRALESRAAQLQREQKSWFAWEKAARTVEAVKKDIKVTAKGSVQNLPKEGPEFCKSAREYCERICRGDEAAPAAGAADRPAPALSAPGGHPYLQRMEHRGGGYAILRALWDAEKSPGYPGFMTKDQICRQGQQYCSTAMEASFYDDRLHNYGWESNKSLVQHRLIERMKLRSRATGFKGPKDQISLTDEGRRFVPLMLEKFNETDDGAPPPEAPSFGRRTLGPPNKLSQKDEAELRAWVATAQPGDEKPFQVGKDRRQRLHEVVKELNTSGEHGLLSHQSHGAGRSRVLVIKKEGNSAKIGRAQLSKGPTMSGLSELLGGLPFIPGMAVDPAGSWLSEPDPTQPSEPGRRLGGKRPAEGGAREVAAAAAERRLSAARPELACKRPRLNPAPAAAVACTGKQPHPPPTELSAPSSSSSSSSSGSDSSDSEADPDLQAAKRLSLAALAETQRSRPDEDAQLEAVQRQSGAEAVAEARAVTEAAEVPAEPAQASPAKFARRLSAPATKGPVDLDMSDDSQGAGASAEPEPSTIALIVDRCERKRNRAPREIYEELQSQLEGSAEVRFETLKLGDYMWLDACDKAVGACVERKTVRDLVARSARGDHLRQLRRLGSSDLPGVLLLEGSLSVADNKATPFGAEHFSQGSTDPALRDSDDVLEFLAWAVLYSSCALLLTADPVETVACLSGWTLVLRDCAWAKELAVPMSTWRRVADASDEDHGTILEAGRLAGFSSQEMDVIGCRFASVTSLQTAYAACRDHQRRHLLLARLLLAAQGDGDKDEARAVRHSSELFRAAGGPNQDPARLRMPTVKLSRRATENLAHDLRLLVPAQLLRAATEGARLQLEGTGDFQGFRSAPCHVHLVEGSSFLRVLQHGLAKSPCPAEAAERSASELGKQLVLSSKERHVILVHGLKAAAKRLLSREPGSPTAAAARKVHELFPAVVAVLILKHKVSTLSWPTRKAAVVFLEALCAQLEQGELLQA